MVLGEGFAQSTPFYPDNWRSDTLNTKRLKVVGISAATFYGVTMTGLYYTWYKPYSTGKFHLFNDNTEWEGMDKVGHSLTAYQLTHYGKEALWWTGMNNTKSTLYGVGYALLYQTTVEVFDGYSDGWGFSWGDMAANTIGAGFYAGQQLVWKEQRFSIKWSYSPSEYAQYRENLLGQTWNERMLKDYNGQTYWLSGNISSFLKDDTKFPKWINVAGGYGAEGMTGAHYNPSEVNGKPIPEFDRYRQFYFSLDVDFTRIPTQSKFLKTVFIALSFVKIPFPALEFNTKGETIFHPIMF
tara:strand:+ start:31211 stop:32101 length:891 start_codon:yes stop_codon:yes gene_type:complete